jgi:hypothetical protein
MQWIFEEPLVWLLAEGLAPVLPALILFWALPSAGQATGTFKGLHIKFGGAFAGYFAVFVLLLFYGPKPPAAPPRAPSTQWQAWELTGRVAFKDAGHSPPPNSIQLIEVPSPIKVESDGSFTAYFMVKPGPTGKLDFPRLNAQGPVSTKDQAPQYASKTVSLDGKKPEIGEVYQIERDENAHEIDIKNPIVIEELTSTYSPNGTPFADPTPSH